MSLFTLQVTLGAGNTQVSAISIPCRQVTVQNNAAHVCRVGDSNVSATRGASLAISGGSFVAGPFDSEAVDLRNLYINGTAADVIDVIYVQ